MSYHIGVVSETTSYVVVRGDTLDKIAKKYGTTYQELARINSIADPNKISVGQVIQLKEQVPVVVVPPVAETSSVGKKIAIGVGIVALVGGVYFATRKSSTSGKPLPVMA